MAVIVRVVMLLLSALLIAFLIFELLRPDVLLVGNVTVDVLHGGSIGAIQSTSRPGGESQAC